MNATTLTAAGGSPVGTGTAGFAFAAPASVRLAAIAALDAARLDTEELTATLAERIAARHQVAAGNVIVAAGSTTLLAAILLRTNVMLLHGQVVVSRLGRPAFQELPSRLGFSAHTVPSTMDGSQDLDEIIGCCGRNAQAVLLSNPHYPTGSVISEPRLNSFLDAVPSSVLVILDETYRPFVTDPTVGTGLRLNTHSRHEERTRPNVAVLHDLAISHALPGLPCSYLITANAEMARSIRTHLLGTTDNPVGEAAAIAALDAESRREYRPVWQAVIRERRRVRNALRGSGFDVAESHGPFLWLDLRRSAAPFIVHCTTNAVHIHDYQQRGAVGVPISAHKAVNDRLIATAASFRHSTAAR